MKTISNKLNKLPHEIKSMWAELYSIERKKGRDATSSTLISTKAIHRMINSPQMTPMSGSKTSIKKSILQSLVSMQPVYHLESTIDFFKEDSLGYKLSSSFISQLSNPRLFEEYGTIEHSEFTKDLNNSKMSNTTKVEPPYIVISNDLQANKLKLKLKLNPNYEDFDNLVVKHKQGELSYISPEFKEVVLFNNLIVSCQKIGFSTTNTPKQTSNRITHMIENGRKEN